MSIQWNPQTYLIDGAPGFLLSGEFHYFRVPRAEWQRRLRLFKETGGNCIATYIPWLLHEPEEGDIRFGDVPERDLEAFLQLCQAEGLYAIVRPGPYVYSEMYCGGLPRWLCEGYPELLARKVDGDIISPDAVSYLHPLFLEKAKTWYDAVCPLIARYTVANGGPIALVQVDNELIGIHEWRGSYDYHPATMGIGTPGGRYPTFLKARYGSIGALNAAYNTTVANFAEVMPVDGAAIATTADRRRVKDYQDFYFGTVGEYMATLISWARAAGITTGIVHNSGNPVMNAYFLEITRRLGGDFLLGSDHYYNLGPDWDQNNPTPQYAVKVLYSNEMLRLMGYPPTVFEMPGGSTSDWPPMTTEDLRCCYLTNIALGTKGINYYVFTGGPGNPHALCHRENYDYGAAISAEGEIRPHYYTQQEVHTLLHQHPWLAQAGLASDFRLGLDFEHARSRHYFSGSTDFEMSNDAAWKFVCDGLTISALNSALTPAFASLDDDAICTLTDQPLVVGTSVCMAAEKQRRVIRFVENGGHLVLLPVIPYLDENFHPCTLLRDFLGGATVEHVTRVAPRLVIGETTLRENALTAAVRPRRAERIAYEETSDADCGWRVDFPGGGRVIWLGMHWRHRLNEHARILQYLLAQAGIGAPTVRCDNPHVWAVVRSDGAHRMLFLINLYSAPMRAQVAVRQADGNYVDLDMQTLAPMEVRTMLL